MRGKEPGDFDGVMVRTTLALAKKCAVRAQFIEAPSWSRAYKMAVDGVVDALIPTSKSLERQALFYYPASPQYVLEISVFSAAARNEPIYSGLDMLAGKRIGKLDNALIEETFDTFAKAGHLQLSERATVRRLFQGLLRGRFDYVIGDTLSGNYYAEQLGAGDKIIALEPPIGRSSEYLAFSRKSHLMKAPLTARAKCLLGTSLDED